MKSANRVVKLRRELYERACEELRRRREAEVDPETVEATIAELERLYDTMEEHLRGTERWAAIIANS